MMSLDNVLMKADVVYCIVDGTGGGMIQTPDDHFQHLDRAWNSGSLYANTHTGLSWSNSCVHAVFVFLCFSRRISFIVYL